MATQAFREDLPTFGDEYDGVKMRQFTDSVSRYFRRSSRRSSRLTTVNSATYDVDGNDEILLVTRTLTGACTINMPDAELWSGLSLVVYDAGANAGTNAITVTPDGSATVIGLASYTINTDSQSVTFTSDGSNWFVEAIG